MKFVVPLWVLSTLDEKIIAWNVSFIGLAFQKVVSSFPTKTKVYFLACLVWI